MMSKKGLSFGRIMLYILFITILGFIIYSLVLTYKEIKKKEPASQNSSLRMQSINSSSENLLPTSYVVYDSTSCSSFYVTLDSGTYTISYSGITKNTGAWQAIINDTASTYNLTQTSITFTIPSNNSTFRFYCNQNMNGANFMLNSGSTALAYTPFVFEGYESVYNYSGADYFSNAYFNFYNSADFVSSYNNGTYNSSVFGYNTSITSIMTGRPGKYVTLISDYDYALSDETPYFLNVESYKSSYVINVGSMLHNFYQHATNTQVLDYGNFNYFTGYMSSSHTYNNWFSGSIILNCNIPLNLFEGSLNGNFNSGTLQCYLKGDSGNYYSYTFSHNFTYDSLPSSIKSTNSYITQIVIPTWQSASSTGNSLYFPRTTTNYTEGYYISYSYPIELVFTPFTQDNSYQEGYQAGYTDGVNAADSALVEYNSQLVDENNALKGNINSLNSKVTQQQNVIAQLQSQIDNSSNNFRGLFFTMADIPFKTVHSALGFEFWGVNLFEFFVGVLTALGIIWLIKKIL